MVFALTQDGADLVPNSNLPPKRPMEQRLEQVLRLALHLALLGAQPLDFVDDLGELLLERERRHDCRQCFDVAYVHVR